MSIQLYCPFTLAVEIRLWDQLTSTDSYYFSAIFYTKVCVIFSHRMLPMSTNKTIAQCMVFLFTSTDTIET